MSIRDINKPHQTTVKVHLVGLLYKFHINCMAGYISPYIFVLSHKVVQG